VLVADAGTALSLTRVDRAGRFAGGRLLAGAGLQMWALGQATTALPQLDPTALMTDQGASDWPAATDQAMAIGISRGLAAALLDAAQSLQASETQPHQRWLTGGDGPWLAPLLAQAGQSWRLEPQLVLDALAELRPTPDP
jgi:type III pantothenate kinase